MFDFANLDLTEVAAEDLQEFSRRIEKEFQRRRVLVESPLLAEELSKNYLTAAGRAAMEDTAGNPPTKVPEYVQPLGAHDAYPLGFYVTQEGTTYKSKRSGNVWEPKLHLDLWERVDAADVPTPAPTPTPPAWELNKVYATGDTFLYNGQVYRVVQPHTSAAHWTPGTVPALYTVVG